MARYQGRVVIKKVNEKGIKIKDLSAWLKVNPDGKYFDSYPEWEVWNYLTNNNIKYKEKITLNLFPSTKTLEFQQPRQTKKAKTEGRDGREIKQIVQQSISYTPDYYLPEFDTYIEVKGFADELFKMRWKLFKLKGYKGFVVYSLEEFKDLYNKLKSNQLLSNTQ